MLLAEQFEIPSQVSVVHNPEHKRLFRELSVNVLENPENLIAEYLYRAVQRPSIEDFMHLADGAEIFEITVGRDTPIAGRTLAGATDADVLPEGVLTVFSKRGFDPSVVEVFSEEATRRP